MYYILICINVTNIYKHKAPYRTLYEHWYINYLFLQNLTFYIYFIIIIVRR